MPDATASTVERIVEAICDALAELGLHSVTIGSVAERAKVSTALVHYHFDTKARLLVAAARRMATERAEQRSRAVDSARGLDALDALWTSVEEGARAGRVRGQLELALYSRADPDVASALAEYRANELAGLVKRLPGLLRELGATAPADVEELASAIHCQLDGLTLLLLAGQDPATVRAAYDAFWLTLISAGQSRRR